MVLPGTQVGINSPVTKISTVRGLHYDVPTEVWAGLLYMRQARDTARGGHFRGALPATPLHPGQRECANQGCREAFLWYRPELCQYRFRTGLLGL